MSLSNRIIADFLRNIPQSNQEKATFESLSNPNQDQANVATLYGVAQMLKMLGIVQIDEHHSISKSLIQASSQTAKYALLSFADYLERNERLINDWETRGIQESFLTNGATFLYAVENNRINRFATPAPSRFVRVAQVLIKRINPETKQHELLFQFDAHAHQYQLIGGRWSEKDGNDLLTTAIREIEEELHLNMLSYPETYRLKCLISDLKIEGSVSTTFGALTHYTFGIYHMYNLKSKLMLAPEDCWVPIDMVLDGVIQVGSTEYPFTSPEIYRRIHDALDGGLRGLPVSLQHTPIT